MVELVDTLVSGTSASQLGGSSPPQGIFLLLPLLSFPVYDSSAI